MNSKKYIVITFILTAVMLGMVAIPIIKIDPFFHYHTPLEQYEYMMEDPWYINYGIIKNYDYDAMITGTSMTANFKSSELDRLFGTNSIKVPFEGASFKELGGAIREACEENENLKMVVCGLDMVNFSYYADYEAYNDKPEYLYDDFVLNDIPYIFNKEVLFTNTYFRTVKAGEWGYKQPTFDDYRIWYGNYVYSKESVLERYTRPDNISSVSLFDEPTKEKVYENITENLIHTVAENPDVTFYFFYTPHNVLFFDRLLRQGIFDKCMASYEYAAQLLLEYDNVKLYSFYDNTDMICDFNNYKDYTHYGHHVNSWILTWLNEGTGLLTKENYKQHFNNMREFYSKYNYDDIFSAV
ncbi:MAG: hypothetical protein IJ410_01820 [Oscillospiraceae bacterium]|nr:hypothetical protein [Oscillospiraceae bacterium]